MYVWYAPFSKEDDVIIVRWVNSRIDWVFENEVRPATKAERILYGELR